MGRRRSGLPSGRSVPTAPLIDVKVLVIAALVASPAAYRASQGLLTVDQALTRFLLVALACLATATVVRGVWPVLAGPVQQPGAAADPALAATGGPVDGPAGPDGSNGAELSPPPG